MNVSVTRRFLVLGVAAGILGLLSYLGLRVADASPAPPAAPATGSTGAEAAATPAPDPESVPRPDPVTVAAVATSFGDRLADRRGWSLYTFSLDRRNDSHCTGRCAELWRPARSAGGKPQPGAGIHAPMVGSMQRDDGSDQITFGGRPLYYYSGDTQPGSVEGHGRSSFGGTWRTDAHLPALPARSAASR